MQPLLNADPVLFQLVDACDVPSLYHIFSEEKELLPAGMHAGLCKVLKEKHCVHFLCQKYKLPRQDTFMDFFAHWRRKHLFSESVALAFIRKHAPSTFTQPVRCSFAAFSQRKMLRKAAKKRRLDFVGAYLYQHRLYKSWSDIQAVNATTSVVALSSLRRTLLVAVFRLYLVQGKNDALR